MPLISCSSLANQLYLVLTSSSSSHPTPPSKKDGPFVGKKTQCARGLKAFTTTCWRVTSNHFTLGQVHCAVVPRASGRLDSIKNKFRRSTFFTHHQKAVVLDAPAGDASDASPSPAHAQVPQPLPPFCLIPQLLTPMPHPRATNLHARHGSCQFVPCRLGSLSIRGNVFR